MAPRSHTEAIQALKSWIDTEKLQGVSGIQNGADTYFVPKAGVKKYLTLERIRALLFAVYGDEETPHGVTADLIIAKKCVRMFTILVYLDGGHFIPTVLKYDHLADRHLPFLDKPTYFPYDGESENELWTRFKRIQWQFCTMPIKYGIDSFLDEHQILPLKSKTKIGEGISADIFRIEFHPGYNKLFEGHTSSMGDMHSSSDTFVLKTFNSNRISDAKSHYEQEIAAFARFGKDETWQPNLIGFFGSYKHGEVYNIILENADQGNLNDLLANPNIVTPSSGQNIYAYWNNMFGLIGALWRIHEWNDPVGTRAYQGCHHDIKPSNILLVTDQRNPEGPPRFVLADLGLTCFTRLKAGLRDVQIRDPQGTQSYGAPECYRKEDTRGWALETKREIDIWSLGCIFSEFLTWIVLGSAEVVRYRGKRSQERSQMGFNDGDLFHANSKLLSSVIEQHQKCCHEKRHVDSITPLVVRDLLREMLGKPNLRPDARKLSAKADLVLADAANAMIADLRPSSSPPLSPTEKPPDLYGDRIERYGHLPHTMPSSQNSNGDPRNTQSDLGPPHFAEDAVARMSKTAQPINGIGREGAAGDLPGQGSDPVQGNETSPRLSKELKEQPPKLSREALSEWYDMCKRRSTFDRVLRSPLPPLKGQSYLATLDNRDMVFIIDDSDSMKHNKTDLKKLFQHLGYLTKQKDPDGIELIFMSDGKRRRSKQRATTELVSALTLHEIDFKDRTNAALRIDQVLKSYLQKALPALGRGHDIRPMIVYVLTDGVWQGTSEVGRIIGKFTRDLEHAGADKHLVGIQFIQFGDNEKGKRRLRYYDEGLVPMGVACWDIVDFEPANGDVLKMLLGSIHEWWDQADELEALDESNWETN